MTIENVTFISLNDIVSVRTECTACHARVEVPLTSAVQALALAKYVRCPNCSEQWFQSQSDPRYQAFYNFVSYLIDLQGRVIEFEKTGMNVRISLQIAEENSTDDN